MNAVTFLSSQATSRDSRPPVGIFATNDSIALRCYESAQRAGARVGEDVLIVGFDDEPRSAEADPPLTTLHQPIEAMAAHAVDLLAASGAKRRTARTHPGRAAHAIGGQEVDGLARST